MSLTVVRIVVLTLFCKNAFGNSLRVNRGSKIDIRDAPYMTRIGMKLSDGSFVCDGSILDDQHILTAGHCVTDDSSINVPNPPLYDPSVFRVIVGTTIPDYEGQGEVFAVSKVFFREFSSKNDLAILKLKSKIHLDGKTKIAVTLPANAYYSPRNRTAGYVDGWGTNPEKTINLLRADIYTMSVQECGGDRTYQICTFGNNGAGPCQGDSGGPMLRASDGVQIGVVSTVPRDCSNPGESKSVFTSVSRNLPWIQSIMFGDKMMDQVESGYKKQEGVREGLFSN